jgi:hypothetical protein
MVPEYDDAPYSPPGMDTIAKIVQVYNHDRTRENMGVVFIVAS